MRLEHELTHLAQTGTVGMRLSERGLALIKGFEGYHRALPDGGCVAYRCPAGVWTIGYGCTEGVREGMIWTRADAEARLLAELRQHEIAVERATTVPLNQNEFDALVSFSYNVGTGALGKSTLLRKLNAGDREGAALEFGKWTRGGGRVLPGLVTRRGKEAALFAEPIQVAAEPEMPQRVDEPVSAAPGPLPKSGTVWGSIAGMLAAIGAYWDAAVQHVLTWVSTLTEMSPIKSAAVEAGANAKAVMLGIGVSAGVLVIARRVKAAQEGKAG